MNLNVCHLFLNGINKIIMKRNNRNFMSLVNLCRSFDLGTSIEIVQFGRKFECFVEKY